MTGDAAKKAVDLASRAASFAVDSFCIDHPQMYAMPKAIQTRLTVEAALAYLVGNDLVNVRADKFDTYLPVAIPDELIPEMPR